MAGFSAFIWPFFFWGKRIWAPLLLKCLWFVPWVRLYWQQFGEQIASTRNSPPIASIETIKSKSVKRKRQPQRIKVRRKKRIRSCVAIRARLFSISSRARWVCDWHMDQSVDFWSRDFGLMRPRPKFGKREIIANIWLAKNWIIC